MDRIGIIIPVHNRLNTTLSCLGQLQNIQTTGFKVETIIIDDGSTDGTPDAVKENYPNTEILKGDGNLWWAGGVNKGFDYALEKGFDFVYLINDDIQLFPDTLQILYDTLKIHKNSVCSSISLIKKDYVYYAGYKIVGPFKRTRSLVNGALSDSFKGRILKADTLSTKSVLIPTEIIKKGGCLDSKNLPHNYSDWDYFIRLKQKGYSLLVNMDSRIETGLSDSNFHHLILEKNRRQIIKTFFDIKYANHLKTMYIYSKKDKGFITGHVGFVINIFPYIVWAFMKVILSDSILLKILKRTGRIETG